jgi:DNA invertase Pin-like site-specific DNA recombinase
LQTFAEQHGTLYKVFTDQESGGKADRTEFKALLLEAYQKKFYLVVFLRLDRFSREGALATLRYLKELKDHGVSASIPTSGHRAPAHVPGHGRRTVSHPSPGRFRPH